MAAAPAGPDGLELQVEVTFEPSSIGDNYHETLLVSSAAGGEYECQVNGRCLPPKPSGPFEMVKVLRLQLCMLVLDSGMTSEPGFDAHVHMLHVVSV